MEVESLRAYKHVVACATARHADPRLDAAQINATFDFFLDVYVSTNVHAAPTPRFLLNSYRDEDRDIAAFALRLRVDDDCRLHPADDDAANSNERLLCACPDFRAQHKRIELHVVRRRDNQQATLLNITMADPFQHPLVTVSARFEAPWYPTPYVDLLAHADWHNDCEMALSAKNEA